MQNTYQEKLADLEVNNSKKIKKLEGGINFKIKSDFQPSGDQPEAIKQILKNLKDNKQETKGKVALALSDAVGTPGSLADKAAALNKGLLAIASAKKKDEKDIAKLAFAAATELEGKRIDAGKLSQRQKDINRLKILFEDTNFKNISNAIFSNFDILN